MDPRHRADEALARARARGTFVVTPDNATSPMDAASTVRIPREMIGEVVDAADSPTESFALPTGPEPVQGGWPTEDYGYGGQQDTGNPFGTLGSRLNPGE